jgi:antitoxin component of MazEF toxin-antitoxin module
MSIDRKLIRNGNGWALTINSTILGFLDVDPETDMVKYSMENDKLIITKSDKKLSDRKK